MNIKIKQIEISIKWWQLALMITLLIGLLTSNAVLTKTIVLLLGK